VPKKPATPLISIALEPVSLDLPHAAQFLGTSVRQIRTLIYAHSLKPIRLGKKQLLLTEDLRTFMRAQKQAA
jgi:hypothetical protein